MLQWKATVNARAGVSDRDSCDSFALNNVPHNLTNDLVDSVQMATQRSDGLASCSSWCGR